MENNFLSIVEESGIEYSSEELIYKDEVYKIIGLCMEIHRELGPGFLEIVYKDAMELEFKRNEIEYEREVPCNVIYKGELLRGPYFADFKVFGNIIIEVKAQRGLSYGNFQQTINYLAGSGLRLGILINFGDDSLKFKRVIK